MKSKKLVKIFSIVIVVAATVFAVYRIANPRTASAPGTAKASTAIAAKSSKQPAAPAPVNRCANNANGQVVLVSTSERHLWACEGTNLVYETVVITGYDGLASTVTPTGTYEIYRKQVEQTLQGSDEKGAWDELAHYWEPFLSNEYGIYGFHDATWRADTAFGNIPTTSKDASHGCIELPLAAMKWFYTWSAVGTTLIVT